MIKNVQAIVQDAIGYSYTWTVVSSDCSAPIISTNLGYGTENNVAGNGTITASPAILKNTITTSPDNCAVTVALEIFNTTNELCNQYYFDLESNIVNANYNWKCVDINDGYGCQQFAGLPTVAGEFDSEALCNACTDCPCNQDNINEVCDCVIDVAYDCNTSTLTITNNSNIVDTNCLSLTIGDIYIENDIVYSGGTLLIGYSIVIPNLVLPNGTYYTSFVFVGNGLINSCNFEKSFLVNCVVGETNNVYCCNQIANDATGNVANINNKDGYILDITGISNTLYIDFGYNMVADQIFVYTGVQDIDNLIPGDLIASTPPCGDTNSCHNNVPCIDNITDDVINGFWTGTGIYAALTNPGIGGQLISDRNNLSPAWSSELYDINTATHTNPGFLPTATGGGILAGQGRLAILAADYINPSNKLTIVVYNNGSICPYNTPNCNNTYNRTAYKFVVVCPNCEQPEIIVECAEIVTNSGNVLINTTPGEYTDFSFDVSDKICKDNIYFAIDYNMGTVVDRLKVYYDNTVVASTPYIGVMCNQINLTNNLPICNNIASTTSTPDCYMSGFYLNTNIAPDAGKNSGILAPVTPIPVLNPLFTFPSALAEGTGRLIVNVPYVGGQDIAVLRLINNYDVPGTCNTFWNISPVCLPCDCPPITTPIVNVIPSDCIIEQGYIDIIQDCETINGYSSHLQYSFDGLVWVDEAPTYNVLPALDNTTQSLYTRCVVDTNEFCFGDVHIDSYIKPECCPDIEYTLECNTNIAYPTYTYHINYIIPECEANPSNSTVQDTGSGYVYLESYVGNSIILDVYFNNNSIYNLYVNCDLCFTSQYILSSNQIQNEIDNLVCISECPTLEVTSNAPVCAGTTLQLTSTITNTNPLCTGITYSWTSNSLTPFTSNLANPTILNVDSDNAGTYILNVTYSSPACTNCILTDSVIVNGFPLPSIPTGYTNVSICAGTSTTLTSVNLNPCCNICTVNWYSALTGGTLLYTGVSYITPILNTTTTYYVTCESINGGCESTPRTPVVVTVAPCCTTTMSANNISTCLDTNGGILPVIYTFSTACTTSSVTANFINGWTYNSITNEISYPPNTSAGTYAVNLDWICDTCFGTTTINVILNKPIVTAVPINNTCPTTSVSLYNAISTTPFVTINSGNTIFKTGATCNSNGLLTGGTTIPAISAAAWNIIGTTTIYYQYTDSVTNCKSCGSFVATVNACCNTTMTVNDVVTCLSPTGGTVNLVANYTPACLTGDIVSVTLPTPNWSFNPTNNSITYPANVAPNTYSLTATLNCGVCTTLYTFSFTINTATVTMQDIANDCNNLLNPTTVDLNDAIVTSDPLYTIVYRQYNILTNNTPKCSSTGTLTGGLLINNPTSWTVPIGTTTIYYQYTNTATGCKKCGSFIVTGTTCCTVSAGDNTTQTICI